MAELDKKLYIKKDSVEQTVTLYTTSEEAGEDYAYIKVDGTQAYIPLGEVDDSRATIGKIQKSSGSQFSILATAKISYHKDSYTNAGTYTWTCPADVTKARVTVAGGGGGGVASKWFTKYHGASGGNGANKTSTIDVIPHRTYTVVVGAGGAPCVSTNNEDFTSSKYAGNGGVSSFDSLTAAGGQGGYYIKDSLSFNNGTSYGSGGAGGSTWDTGANAGGTGWVYVEYGGDI